MFKTIINPTEYGEYKDKTILCEICKTPKSIAIIFDKQICMDCLNTAITCILRAAGKASGFTHKPPPYKETPTQTFPIKTEKEIK